MSSEMIPDTSQVTTGPPMSWSVLGDGQGPPKPPLAPEHHLSEDQLTPLTPSLYIESKSFAYASELNEFCLKHPIAVLRGLTTSVNINLDLFSTKTLVKTCPRKVVELRSQLKQSVDENWDNNGNRRVWACESLRSHTTITKHARYQVTSLQKSFREEQKRSALDAGSVALSDTDGLSSGGPIKDRPRKLMIRFATNVDLCDKKKWRAQLMELKKLPTLFSVDSYENMLSYVGHVILGVNTVQVFMYVPGSRTTAHQENNNFCCVNINIGPGDCEWFGVPNAYWRVVNELCERHDVNFLQGSWWPDPAELRAHGVPVYHFTQRSGDLVWINTGCVYWVQATGWCNNISWNVGPITATQYTLALERYEWNKEQKFQSIVPMVHLTWNLARYIKVADRRLYCAIRACLLQTLRAELSTLAVVEAKNVPISFHGRAQGEITQYCIACKREVWHALLVRKHDNKQVVYCLECALLTEPNLEGFVCLEEHQLDDLVQVFSAFDVDVDCD